MAAMRGPNHPDGRTAVDKIRLLRRRLWRAAKQSPGRRFHALYDHLWRSDILREAWELVKTNKGSAGVDRLTIDAVEERGVDAFLEDIATALRDRMYRPAEVLRRYIPKSDGKRRPLGIPTVRDRVVQMAAKLVLEPIFEADFVPCSYGFRPQRSATMALEELRKLGNAGGNHVLDADIQDYFGSIDHARLMEQVGRRVSDRRILTLLRRWLKAGVLDEGQVTTPTRGTPQGGVISPLLSNIYLHELDAQWTRQKALGHLVRYADDFVVLCATSRACEQAEERIRAILGKLGLSLHPTKTRRVDLTQGCGGFDFLGCHLRKRMSGRIWERSRRKLYYLHRCPSAKAMARMRSRIRELTPRGRCHDDIRDVIADINPALRGWGNYFRTGNAARRFNQMDSFVWQRLHLLRIKRKGRNLSAGEASTWTRDYFHHLGLHRLRGTVKYPGMPSWEAA
jgi:group II intron reverse transcriptase/maturase